MLPYLILQFLDDDRILLILISQGFILLHFLLEVLPQLLILALQFLLILHCRCHPMQIFANPPILVIEHLLLDLHLIQVGIFYRLLDLLSFAPQKLYLLLRLPQQLL